MPKILVADDNAEFRTVLIELLQSENYEVSAARTGKEVLAAVTSAERPELVIMDLRMPEMSGMDALRRMQDDRIDVGVLMMTAFGTSNLAIQTIQLGAYDYITKPFDLVELLVVVQRYFEHRSLQGEVQSLRRKLGASDPSEQMVGRSSAMLEIYKTIGRVAASDASVLVTGETGTGKEMIADFLHRNSSRKQGELVKVACATLPETLLESELFGHEKGSFTSAHAQRKGRFELADKGTIFLDEIGEMTLSTQKKLLRVLQEKEFERVGGMQTIHADFRVVAATNKDLAAEVAKKTFREDLFYRLNVISIHMPALRERDGDIILLVEHFLNKSRLTPNSPPSRISKAALDVLEQHDWPGNVRELENTVARAVIMAHGGVITAEHLSIGNRAIDRTDRLTVDLYSILEQQKGFTEAMSELESRLLSAALHRAGGQLPVAAVSLGISISELTSKLSEFALLSPESAAALV